MTRSRIVILVALAAVLVAVGWSARPHAATQAERVDRITAELRCVVCQGLSVKDSPAESARQMRGIVIDRVAAGRTDEQIRDEFRANYGDWVLLAPPLGGWSAFIWVAPVAAVLFGFAIGWRWLNRKPAALPDASPSDLAALRERVAREEALDLPGDAS